MRRIRILWRLIKDLWPMVKLGYRIESILFYDPNEEVPWRRTNVLPFHRNSAG